MATKKCPVCGETINKNARFCEHCGRDLSQIVTRQRPEAEAAALKKKNKNAVIVLAMILVSGLGLAYMAYRFPSEFDKVLATKTAEAVTPEREVSPEIDKLGFYKPDVRALAKNPDSFKDRQIQVEGEVFTIEESDKDTVIQMWVQKPGNNQFDREPIAIYTTMNTAQIYEGTNVRVYGFGAGAAEGKNAFGTTVRLPVIVAKYIDILR